MQMKKMVLMGILSSCLLVGCKSGAANLTAGKLENATFSVNKEGNVQVAMVESFDKPYYDETELENYLNEIIASYNEEEGKNSVKMSSFFAKNGIASAVFAYEQMEDYKALNEVEGEFLSLKEAEPMLPDKLQDMEGKEKSVEEILQDADSEKYKVLFMKEEYDVVVEGTIQFYTNAAVVDKNLVHTTSADTSVIIFK